MSVAADDRRKAGADVDEMSTMDHMVWRVETGDRARPVIVIVVVLDRVLAWEQLTAWHEGVVALMPRMRARVVTNRGFLHRSQWVPDPDFSVSHHLKRVRVTGKGTRRDLLDTVEVLAEVPFREGRSPWEGYLIDDLEDGRSAYMLKISHSIADGIRLREMFLRMSSPAPARPAPAKTSRRGGRSPWSVGRRVRKGVRFLAQAGRDMLDMAHPAPSAGGHFARRYFTAVVPLLPLRKVAADAGGTVQDALVAAVAEGCRRYYRQHQVDRPLIRVFSPYQRPPWAGRNDPDPQGNHWFIVRYAVSADAPGIGARIQQARAAVDAAYHVDSTDWMKAIARMCPLIPGRLFHSSFLRLCASHDFIVSNIPGPRRPQRIGDAEAEEIFGIAPTLGSGLTVTLLSYRNACHIAINIDPNVIPDPELLERCVREGLEEATAAGEPPEKSSEPAPFSARSTQKGLP
jgi:diacylglycerol O-acyltransferase